MLYVRVARYGAAVEAGCRAAAARPGIIFQFPSNCLNPNFVRLITPWIVTRLPFNVTAKGTLITTIREPSIFSMDECFKPYGNRDASVYHLSGSELVGDDP